MANQASQESISHLTLCQVMKNSDFAFTDYKNQKNILTDFIISSQELKDISVDEKEEIQARISLFVAKVIPRYKRDRRNFSQFLSNPKNAVFLQTSFSLPDWLSVQNKDSEIEKTPEEGGPSKRLKLGRKPLPFDEKSVRAKQYASAKVREQHDPGAIILAASQQTSTLGTLVRKTKSPSGTTARLALNAITSPQTQGT